MVNMDKNQNALWERVLAYRFDNEGSAFPYSAKVAKENGWSQAYTYRVIEEYRRFAFLAVAAGHPVSPPEAVDQAWHIHILYTREYNDVFCAQVLGQHLHHGPSIGGRFEDEKFQDWYSQTLMSYKTMFGEEPPKDIWPSAEQRAKQTHHFQRVDKQRSWIIPKPFFVTRSREAEETNETLNRMHDLRTSFWRGGGLGCVLASLTPLLIVGCAAQNGAVNPLDYDGPSFLQFYIGAFVLGTVAAAVVRHYLRPPGPDSGALRHLEPAEVAFLNGGSGLVLHSALASLMSRNLVTMSSRKIVKTAEAEPSDLSPVERAVLRSTGQVGVWAKDVGAQIDPEVQAVKVRLQTEGLVMEDEAASRNLLATWLVALVAPLTGIAKLAVGVNRDKPVGILIAMLVVSAVVLLVAFTRRGWRSRKGDQALDNLKASLAGYSSVGQHANANPSDYAMAVAIFGIPALAGTAMYDDMRPIRQNAAGTGSSGCGTACGSSCSSSSSSDSGGGGGDGGGGCGGGGCGGCGGGGD